MAKKSKRGNKGGGKGSSSERRKIIPGYKGAASNNPDNDTTSAPQDRKSKREADLGQTLIHLGLIWLVVGVLTQVGRGYVLSKQPDGVADVPVVTEGVADKVAPAKLTQNVEVKLLDADKTAVPDGPKVEAKTESGSSGGNILSSVADFVSRTTTTTTHNGKTYKVPTADLQSYDKYPNPANITDEMRASFHPVVVFPKGSATKEGDLPYIVMDFTNRKPEDVGLPTDEEDATTGTASSTMPKPGSLIPPGPKRKALMKQYKKHASSVPFTIGRYDEDRRNMYSSDMFASDETMRSVHVGIDIGCPVGTKVHSFADGVVHSAGYNPAFGDYGHVIVVEHALPANEDGQCDGSEADQQTCSNNNKIWALYGHLDKASIRGKKPGKRIKKGQVLGKVGWLNDNGGWWDPHVHFQLSIDPPETHDLPGVVAPGADRHKALVQYPDPRLVLGPLY